MHTQPILGSPTKLKESLLAPHARADLPIPARGQKQSRHHQGSTAQAMDEHDIAEALSQIQKYGLGRKARQEPRGTLLGLTEVDLEALRLDGSLQALTRRGIAEDETLYDGLGVAFSSDAFEALQDGEDTAALWSAFLNSAHLVSYNKQNDSLHLIAHLPQYQALFAPRPLSEWQEKDADSTFLSGVNDFAGRHMVCGFSDGSTTCGDPYCHAEYAWVSAGTCLAYLTASHAATGLFIYPFGTDFP
jgi:hypothetical protein